MKELISKLTWVDYLTVIAVIRGCYIGYRSGFFPELLRIVSYIVTVAITFHFQETVAQYLILKTFLNQTSANAIAFITILVATFSVAKFLIFLLLKLLKLGEGGIVYRIIGMLVGVARWIILLSLIFMIIDHSPLATLKKDVHENSLVGEKIASVTPVLFDFLSSLSPQLALEKKE